MGTAVPACTLPAPGGVGGTQDLVAAGVQGAVIHVQRVLAPRLGLELGGCQQPLGFQSIQINEIRVARKGRAALVGAVPIARGAQGQDLPDLLACRRKEIHKFFCLFAKAADPVGPGRLDTGIRIPLSRIVNPSSSQTFCWGLSVFYHNITADYFPQAKNVVYLFLY